MTARKKPTINVIFRLVEDEYEALKRAGTEFDESPGQSARRLVRRALRDDDKADLKVEMEELKEKLESVVEKVELLIEMVEASCLVLLTHAGKLTVDDAKEWIASSFH